MTESPEDRDDQVDEPEDEEEAPATTVEVETTTTVEDKALRGPKDEDR